MNNLLNGTVIEVTPQGQTVETDAQANHLKIIHLHGFNRITGNPAVGTKVVLEYRVSPSSGLWWGKAVEQQHMANCEECGSPIHSDFSLCDVCRPNDFDTCDEAGGL